VADPVGVLSIAFDAAPMAASPTWTRIDTLAGCRVQDWTVDRGRTNEFDKTNTGTAVVHLIDLQGLFDPTNVSSPYHNKILPGKQAAIALQNPTGAHAWFTIFRGFVESWHYKLAATEDHMELELQLADGFAILARAELQVGVDGVLPPFPTVPADQQQALNEMAKGNVLYGETTGTVADRINAILGDVDWPAGMRDVFSGNVQVGPKAYGPGTSALDALWDAADAEFPGVANMYISAGTNAGFLTFHGRQARFHPTNASYGIQRRTVGDPGAVMLDINTVPVKELEWSNGQDNLYNACTATPQWIGSGLTLRQLNPDPPDNDNVAGQLVKDDTSIAAYGLRSLAFDQLQTVKGIASGNNSMVETKLFAQYYRDNYKDPHQRVTRMVFKSARPGSLNADALWLHLCKAEISDLLTLKTTHPGGGGFNEDFYVEGIHYTCRPGTAPGGAVSTPIVELALDVSPRAHYTSNPFPADPVLP
jgi:hypothetical protein